MQKRASFLTNQRLGFLQSAEHDIVLRAVSHTWISRNAPCFCMQCSKSGRRAQLLLHEVSPAAFIQAACTGIDEKLPKAQALQACCHGGRAHAVGAVDVEGWRADSADCTGDVNRL